MDGDALKLIQNTAVDANGKRVPAGYESRIAALPNGYTFVDLEEYDPGRRRFRGVLSTTSLADFVQYVKANKNAQGFVSDNKAQATVFFNLGDAEDAGHADHRAMLELERTVPFTALLDSAHHAMTQSELIDFLEDWQHLIVPFSEGVDGSFTDGKLSWAVSAIRRIKIAEGSTTETVENNFAKAQSRLDSVEATSDMGLPAGFRFLVTPHLGLSERNVLLRLSIKTGHRVPMLQLRIIQGEQLKEDIQQEFKSVLLRELSDVPMTIGKFTP